MSKFEVLDTEITEVLDHPNADRLSIYKLKDTDYQVIAGKDEYKLKDRVVYFPVDSIIPPKLVEYLNIGAYLSGKTQKRVKTVKLRGEISQGLIVPLLSVGMYISQACYTSLLGVTKYEPKQPTSNSQGQTKGRLPDGLEVYDLENYENYKDVLGDILALGTPCITEKLEGQNITVMVDAKDEVHVCSRKLDKTQGTGAFWETAERMGLPEKVKAMKEALGVEWLALRGEHIGPGIQGNIYKLDKKVIYFFDIKTPTGYLPWVEFVNTLWYRGLNKYAVPRLTFEEMEIALDNTSVQSLSDGFSELNNAVRREGIVIRPWTEHYSSRLNGRLMLKQRSPEYLAKEK
jgi:RNA ligase (TIGR02306 family)